MRNRLMILCSVMLVGMLLAACGGTGQEPDAADTASTPTSVPALQPAATADALPAPSPTPLAAESGAEDQLTIATQQPYPAQPAEPIPPALPTAATEPYPEGTPQSLIPLDAGSYPVDAEGNRLTLSGELLTEPALVEQVTLTPVETFPFQLEARIEGNHPDACWVITRATQTRDGNTLRLDVEASRSADAVCAQMMTPFAQTYMLDINGLPQGVYIIDVNDVTTEFVLPVDNFMR